MKLDARLDDTSFLVVALHTTGPSRRDRIVELAAVEVEPGRTPCLVFDSTIQPGTPVETARLHGLSDAALDGAPRFQDIAGDLLATIGQRVLVPWNGNTSMPTLEQELLRSGMPVRPPFLNGMELHAASQEARPTGLAQACESAGLSLPDTSSAEADAGAMALLLRRSIGRLAERGVHTLRDLNHAYPRSVGPTGRTPMLHVQRLASPGPTPQRPRVGTHRRSPVSTYQEALLAVLNDPHVTDDDAADLYALRGQLGLAGGELRAIHAKVFAAMLGEYDAAYALDGEETNRIARAHKNLAKLGWAPGIAA